MKKKMASVVGNTLVEESQNFDFEKSGKSFNRRKGKLSWLYKAESDESFVESTENRDATAVTTIYTARNSRSRKAVCEFFFFFLAYAKLKTLNLKVSHVVSNSPRPFLAEQFLGQASELCVQVLMSRRPGQICNGLWLLIAQNAATHPGLLCDVRRENSK